MGGALIKAALIRRIVTGRPPHCAQCASYEQRVMARKESELLPPEVVPCKEFAMSQAFQDWAVETMRKEVLGQVSKAGLDRMAMLKGKAPDPKVSPRPGQTHQRTSK